MQPKRQNGGTMKKILSKLTRKDEKDKKSDRITNQTVAEHREQIIAKARKFKYPIQYTKSKLVRNVAILGVFVVVVFTIFSWWQLYKIQTTSSFFYRLTSVIPVPVASVDGEYVRYSDYLLNYKMSETYLTTIEKINKDNSRGGGKGAYDFYKAQAMQNAISDTYASKLARELNISITDGQVKDAVDNIRRSSSSQGEISQEVYDRATVQYYGITPSEYRYHIHKSLLQREVSYAIDDIAKKAAQEAESNIKSNANIQFSDIVLKLKDKYPTIQNLQSGWVKKDNKDGGLAFTASKLKKGESSSMIKPLRGDGYYFVKLLDVNRDNEINYEFIKIPLSVFNNRLAKLYAGDKIKYFITVSDVKPQIQENNK